MALRLSRVYLFSFCLIGLNDGSILNLCSITFLGSWTYLMFSIRKIEIVPEESGELDFLFGVEICADRVLLLKIGEVGQNFFVGLVICCPFFLVACVLIGRWLGRG
jgi:hypothetical protein